MSADIGMTDNNLHQTNSHNTSDTGSDMTWTNDDDD